MNESNVFPLQSTIGLSDPDDIRTFEILLGILLVNDFEISHTHNEDNMDNDDDSKESEGSLRALFALASMPSHSCVANCTHDFSSRYLYVSEFK